MCSSGREILLSPNVRTPSRGLLALGCSRRCRPMALDCCGVIVPPDAAMRIAATKERDRCPEKLNLKGRSFRCSALRFCRLMIGATKFRSLLASAGGRLLLRCVLVDRERVWAILSGEIPVSLQAADRWCHDVNVFGAVSYSCLCL